jgi:hypothetical protein
MKILVNIMIYVLSSLVVVFHALFLLLQFEVWGRNSISSGGKGVSSLSVFHNTKGAYR